MANLYEAKVPGLEGADNTGGLTTIYALPVGHVASFPAVVGEVVAGDGGSALITGDVTVNDPLTEGATLIYSSRDSQLLDSPVVGEIDGRTTSHNLSFFTPGIDPQRLAFFQKAKNDEFIFFVSQCGGPVIVIGNLCEGLDLIGSMTTGQKTSGRKGHNVVVSGFGDAKIYEGVVPLV